MTETLLERLSGTIVKVYDLELAEELTDIFVDLTDQIREDDYRYFNLAKKLAELQMRYEKMKEEKERQERIVKSYKTAYDVAKDMYDERGEILERIEKEKEQAEYDKEYFAKELLGNLVDD